MLFLFTLTVCLLCCSYSLFPLVFGSTNLSLMYVERIFSKHISNTGSSFTWCILLCSVQMLGRGNCICGGFITRGPFYLYCGFNCLLSSPYSCLVNTYIQYSSLFLLFVQMYCNRLCMVYYTLGIERCHFFHYLKM